MSCMSRQDCAGQHEEWVATSKRQAQITSAVGFVKYPWWSTSDLERYLICVEQECRRSMMGKKTNSPRIQTAEQNEDASVMMNIHSVRQHKQQATVQASAVLEREPHFGFRSGSACKRGWWFSVLRKPLHDVEPCWSSAANLVSDFDSNRHCSSCE